MIHKIMRFIFNFALVVFGLILIQVMCHLFVCPQIKNSPNGTKQLVPEYPWYHAPEDINPRIPPQRIAKWKLYKIYSI